MAADRLKTILQNFAPTQVLPKHAAAIKRELVKTPNMCNRIMSFGRSVFAYALENQLVDINPFVGIRRHKERHRTRLIGTHSDEKTTDVYLRDREVPVVDGPVMARILGAK